MTNRRLSPEETALWDEITAQITPLDHNKVRPTHPIPTKKPSRPASHNRYGQTTYQKPANVAAGAITTKHGLDRHWDKRIRRGEVMIDASLDMHGLNLAQAHYRLEELLALAIARRWRLLHIITGHAGGAGVLARNIRPWLEHSAHTAQIATLRQAHPRHGGKGAWYIILRRSR